MSYKIAPATLASFVPAPGDINPWSAIEAAYPVFNNDRMAQRAGQRLGQRAGRHVGRRATGETHHNANRPGRPGGCRFGSFQAFLGAGAQWKGASSY